LLVYCIFDARNPENGIQHVTGESARPEYDLRKCIAYDAIEYRGTYGQLSKAWLAEEPLPFVLNVDVEEPSDAHESGSAGGSSGVRADPSVGAVAKPKRPDYLRPRKPDGTIITTSLGGASKIKQSAAIALGVILDHIAETRAHEHGLVTFDVDIITIADDSATPDDWRWYVYGAFAVWLLFVHLIAFYLVGIGVWVRVRARFSNCQVSVATQCSRLPDVSVTTVEGLRSELRARGLRTTGLRIDLERRLAAALSESEQ